MRKLNFKPYIKKLTKVQAVLPGNISRAVTEIKDVWSYHLTHGTFWNPAATYVSPDWRAGSPYTLLDSGALKSAMRKSFKFLKKGEFIYGFYVDTETMDRMNEQESASSGESDKPYPYWRNFEYGAAGSWWDGFRFSYNNLATASGEMTFQGGNGTYKYPGIKPVQMFYRTQIGMKGKIEWTKDKLRAAAYATAKFKAYSE